MMLRFSQKAEQERKEKIRNLWNFVKTKSCKDLLIKVFFYKRFDTERIPKDYWNNLSKEDKEKIIVSRKNCQVIEKEKYVIITRPYNRGCKGSFREVALHGFYRNERKFINKGIKKIITLKLSPLASDIDIIGIMAHEYRHYLQSIIRTQASKHKRYEKDANKYEEKIKKKYGTLKHNKRKRGK